MNRWTITTAPARPRFPTRTELLAQRRDHLTDNDVLNHALKAKNAATIAMHNIDKMLTKAPPEHPELHATHHTPPAATILGIR